METHDRFGAVKPATATSYPRLAEIWERSVAATHSFLSPVDFEIFKVQVPAYFPRMEHIVVYDTGESIAGFAAVNERKIEMLFADPDYIGKGIGSALFDYCVQILGADSVDVNEQNTGGLQFYTRKGCQTVSRSELDSSGKPYPILSLRIRKLK